MVSLEFGTWGQAYGIVGPIMAKLPCERVAGNRPLRYRCAMLAHALPSMVDVSRGRPPVLVANGLVRRFGHRLAVRDVSLTMGEGDCLAAQQCVTSCAIATRRCVMLALRWSWDDANR